MRFLPRLTSTGRALLGGGVVLMFCGWALGYAELTLFGAGALVGLLAACTWLFRRSTLHVHREIEPSRVQRGGIALGLVSVENAGNRASLAISAEDMVGSERIAIPLPRLNPGARRTTTYRLPTAKRGVVDVGPLRILQQDPLASLQRAQTFEGVTRLWVHPVVHPLTSSGAGRSRHLDGPNSDSAPQGSITFHSLREYVPGDDRRRIHWRSTAHLGKLMVVSHVDTSRPETTVLLDTRAELYTPELFEEAIDICASVIAASTRNGFPVRLRTSGGVSVPTEGTSRDGLVFLDQLSVVEPTGEGSMRQAAEDLARQKGGDHLVVVTVGLDKDAGSAVAILHRRFHTARVASFRVSHGGELLVPTRGVGLIQASSAQEFARAWNHMHRLAGAR